MDDYVEVTRRQTALRSPNFLVEYKGRLYFTVAALEYDPKARGLTREQASHIKKVRKIYEASRIKVPAVIIDTEEWVYQSSRPKPPAPPPQDDLGHPNS